MRIRPLVSDIVDSGKVRNQTAVPSIRLPSFLWCSLPPSLRLIGIPIPLLLTRYSSPYQILPVRVGYVTINPGIAFDDTPSSPKPDIAGIALSMYAHKDLNDSRFTTLKFWYRYRSRNIQFSMRRVLPCGSEASNSLLVIRSGSNHKYDHQTGHN